MEDIDSGLEALRQEIGNIKSIAIPPRLGLGGLKWDDAGPALSLLARLTVSTPSFWSPADTPANDARFDSPPIATVTLTPATPRRVA